MLLFLQGDEDTCNCVYEMNCFNIEDNLLFYCKPIQFTFTDDFHYPYIQILNRQNDFVIYSKRNERYFKYYKINSKQNVIKNIHHLNDAICKSVNFINDKFLVVPCYDNIFIYDVETMDRIHSILSNRLQALSITPNSKYVIIHEGGSTCQIRVLQRKDEKNIFTFPTKRVFDLCCNKNYVCFISIQDKDSPAELMSFFLNNFN